MKGGKNTLLVMAAIAVVSIAAATMSGAQQRSGASGGTRVAVVDLVKVFNEFDQTKAVNEAMRVYRDKLAQESDQKMSEIKAEQDILDKTDVTSPDRQARITKIKRMQLEYNVWESLEKDFVSDQYVAWVKRTYEMVTDGIAEVAKKQGVQLVVTQEQVDTTVTKPEPLLQQILNRKVVYADNSVDISADVLATLNANFAKLGGPASVHFGK
ncbi:MAG TPA: OmpH family outer membrane protein [Phycisphaerae bacterium]|nr:OmpH family outer membrane protein [Phycisphaerae bacterium]HRR83492.1 OmpH family outer membrane protein [Phycisphaerae bacterium]